MFTNIDRPSAVDVLRPFVIGDLFQADSTTTLARLPDVAVGNVLLSGGVGALAAWGKVTLSSHVSGVLPAVNGGTGVANTGTITNAGNITFTGTGTIATGTFTLTVPATGTAGLLGVANNWTLANTFSLSSGTSLIVSSTTDATSAVAASVTLAGGLAIAKAVFIGTAFNVTPGADASCSCTIGSTSTGSPTSLQASTLTIKAPSSGSFAGTAQMILDSGDSAIQYKEENVNKWWLYRLRTATELYLRDMVNARMHTTFTMGASAEAAITNLNSALTVSSTTDSTTKDTGSIITEGGIGAEKQITAGTGFRTGSTTLMTSSVALTNGAAAQAGTLLNAPAAGNPTKWIPINDNGTTRYIPAW